VSRAVLSLASGLMAAACATHQPVAPAPRPAPTAAVSHFEVIGGASPADTGRHLEAEAGQALRDEPRGPFLTHRQLGMPVQVLVEG